MNFPRVGKKSDKSSNPWNLRRQRLCRSGKEKAAPESGAALLFKLFSLQPSSDAAQAHFVAGLVVHRVHGVVARPELEVVENDEGAFDLANRLYLL